MHTKDRIERSESNRSAEASANGRVAESSNSEVDSNQFAEASLEEIKALVDQQFANEAASVDAEPIPEPIEQPGHAEVAQKLGVCLTLLRQGKLDMVNGQEL